MKRVLAAVALLVPLAACGGGDDDGGDGLSKAEYVSQSEAICTKANADFKAIPFPTTPAAFPEYVGKLVTLAEGVHHKLMDLEAPEADEADLKTKVLDPIEAQIEEGRDYQKELADAVAKNDQAKIGQLVADPPTRTKADTAWMSSYGFKECVKVAETD